MRAIPGAVRRWARRLPGATLVRDWIFSGSRTHDELYGPSYFEMVDETSAQKVDIMATSILRDLRPRSVVDVGCGTGNLIDALRRRDVRVRGLEYAVAALDLCRARGLPVDRFDIENDQLWSDIGSFDVVVSMEVGQQLDPLASDRYVGMLTSLGRVVVFSSAVPGQKDRAPRNEQPHDFWQERFGDLGYVLDDAVTASWRREWQSEGTAPWFANNVMVFRSEP